MGKTDKPFSHDETGITQEQLDEIAEEFKKAGIPSRCEYCKQPVYRIPFNEAPQIYGKTICLDCFPKLMEYEKLNTCGGGAGDAGD